MVVFSTLGCREEGISSKCGLGLSPSFTHSARPSGAAGLSRVAGQCGKGNLTLTITFENTIC